MRRNVYRYDELELTEVRPGLFGAVLEGDQSTLVRWELPAGQPRTGLHVHDQHEQYGFLMSGAVEMEIDGEAIVLRPGDGYWVPAGTPHGRTLVLGEEPAVVLDVFAPPREEYVQAANGGAPVDPTTAR
ncbi:MAG TPA: cupin domain-containing protein [Conexibacter sp.]|jgi:quercetin dioxygenase-like cupin family protein